MFFISPKTVPMYIGDYLRHTHTHTYISVCVLWLLSWCRDKNLLNTSKTKELIKDLRRKKTEIPAFIIGGDCVEKVADLRFLGVHIKGQPVMDCEHL